MLSAVWQSVRYIGGRRDAEARLEAVCTIPKSGRHGAVFVQQAGGCFAGGCVNILRLSKRPIMAVFYCMTVRFGQS